MLLPSIAAPLRHSSLTAVKFNHGGQSYINTVTDPLEYIQIIFFIFSPSIPLSLSISVFPDSSLPYLCSRIDLHPVFEFYSNSFLTYFISSKKNFPLQFYNKMCSVYLLKFDCGCVVQQGDVVHCAARGTASCTGVRQQVRRREGFNCPNHGG